MSEPSEDRRVGTVVGGRYRVTQRLAAGGMGIVYRAERLKLGRAVAIKFLHPTFAANPEAIQRFEVEARAMGRLGHPHTVSVLDFGLSDGVPYVVMDFVQGKTLRELLDAGALPAARSLRLFRQVLAGVAHAHGQGIVHRDLKPANIILGEATGTGDHVRILDFGLAKLHGSAHELSASNVAIGTPSYMSPEQARGETVDVRSDVYSLGVLLFELLTGEKPFFSDQAFEVIHKHANDPPPRLADVAPKAGLSVEMETLVATCLAKKPEDRYQTVAELAAALAQTPEATEAPPRRESSAGIGATTPPPVVDRSPGWRSMLALGAGALLAAGGLFVIGWHFLQLGEKSAAPDAAVAARAAPAAAVTPPAAVTMVPPPAPVLAPTAVPDAAAPDAAPPDAAPADGSPPDAAPPSDGASTADAAAEPDGDPIPEVLPDEQSEPVAAVETDPVPDDEIDVHQSPPAAPAPAPAPAPARTVADVERLIRAGQTSEAISALERLHTGNPRSAYIPYLLGNLYFERRWWTDGLDSYRSAIRANPDLRRRGVLVRNAIRALSSKKTVRNAQAFIRRDVGAAALPYLRSAARSDPNKLVRQRAATLAKQVRRR